MTQNVTRTRRQWRVLADQVRGRDLAARIDEALENAGPYPGDEDIEDHDVPLSIALDDDDVRLLDQQGTATE